MPEPDHVSARQRIHGYHDLSKHRPDRYAPGPGQLDWANQPDPFRRFAGCPVIDLPLTAAGLGCSFAELPQTPAAPAATDLRGVARLFELALGLSAWKVAGASRWALRCNPSSGNLHPTEGYLVCPGLPDLAPGVYHYDSYRHGLEQRAALPSAPHWRAAFGGNLLVGLSGIHWREAWKYGARAWRYCQHDAGHAIGALRYAAATLGWGSRLLTAPGDADIARLLGLDRPADFLAAEPEAAELLLLIGPRPDAADAAAVLTLPQPAAWHGRANRLSSEQVAWPQIDQVVFATGKPRSAPLAEPPLPLPPAVTLGDMPAVDLIRQRRSAVAFDGRSAMPAAAFFDLLDALLPRPGRAPWDVLPWQPRLHPVLFVHRVEGLAPGLYALPRSPSAADRLPAALRAEFTWQPVAGAPAHLPLRQLLAGDTRDLARALACHQDIAADSCFALGMLADFEASLGRGPYWYRWLFWEAGLLGQVLYLQAEALGLRGTGIGCYFDDAMHQVLGLHDQQWQDLYHFTVGAPVEDHRLRTEPPYAHLGGRGLP